MDQKLDLFKISVEGRVHERSCYCWRNSEICHLTVVKLQFIATSDPIRQRTSELCELGLNQLCHLLCRTSQLATTISFQAFHFVASNPKIIFNHFPSGPCLKESDWLRAKMIDVYSVYSCHATWGNWCPTGFVLKASFGAAQVIPEANGVAPQLDVTVTVTINPKVWWHFRTRMENCSHMFSQLLHKLSTTLDLQQMLNQEVRSSTTSISLQQASLYCRPHYLRCCKMALFIYASVSW